MDCSRCGAALGPGVRECPDCGNRIYGNDFVYASLSVSWDEARKGGVHPLQMRNLVNPLKVRVKPRTRSGDKVRVAGAMLRMADESILLAPVEVTVHVGPRPLWRTLLAILLCVLLTGGMGCSVYTAVDALRNRPDAQLSATVPTQPPQTSATVPSSTASSEPAATETTEPETTEPETTAPETTVPETTGQPRSESVIMNFEQRPLLQQLSEDQLANLEAIYQGAMNFETSVTLPREITIDQIDYLVYIMEYECPELMQYDGGIYYYDTATGIVSSYEISYAMDQAEYTRMYDACVEVIDALVAQTQGMTDWEKERYVFDYITSTCTYSMDVELAGTAYGTLVQKIAKCDGISFATKWILEEMGITCIAVNGEPTVGEIGHAWNYILLDGEYYGLDVTADVRRAEDQCPTMYCAYNVTTELVEQTYILYDHFRSFVQTPCVTTMENSYHVQNGSYMTTGADWRSWLKTEFLAACRNGGEFRFQFESTAEFESCKAEMGQICQDAWSTAGISGTPEWIFWYVDGFNVVYVGVTKG